MDIIVYQLLRSPSFLLVEVVVASFLISLGLVTILNSQEGRNQPERFRNAGVAIFVGIAVATGLSALHNSIPFWYFGVSLYTGLTAGFLAFLLAPSKARIDNVLRRISGRPSSEEEDEELELDPEPQRMSSTLPQVLPRPAKAAGLSARRKTSLSTGTEAGVVPRKVSSTFGQERILAQMLELSDAAEREGISMAEIINLLESHRFRKGTNRRIG